MQRRPPLVVAAKPALAAAVLLVVLLPHPMMTRTRMHSSLERSRGLRSLHSPAVCTHSATAINH